MFFWLWLLSRRRIRRGYWSAGRVLACLLALGMALAYWQWTLVVLGVVVLAFLVSGCVAGARRP